MIHAMFRWSRIAGSYFIAVAGVGAVAAAKLLIRPYISEESPFLLFMAAVTAAGWYGGIGPGLVATFLSAAASDYLFLPPINEFNFGRGQALRLSLFIGEGLVISGLCGMLHSARKRAEESAGEARELERMIASVSEAEHRRIGHDLHDGLGQHLTGVAFLSRALQQRLAAQSRPESLEAETINNLVNESIGWTRDLARGMAPVDLDRTTLPAALRELAQRTGRLFRVECSYDGDDAVIVHADAAALNLYRVAQEAINNSVKHGHPRRVSIRLVPNEQGVSLTIKDDGKGFEISPVRAVGNASTANGMGLKVMRYRAGVLGGTLEIVSGRGAGTTVCCQIPYQPPTSALSEGLRL